MDFWDKLLGFEGRLRRRDWWLLSILLCVFQFIATVAAAIFLIGPQEMITEGRGVNTHAITPLNVLTLGIALLLMWPALALIVKRRHDRGGSGALVGLLYILSLAATYAPLSLFGGGAPASLLLAVVAGLANLAVGLVFLIVLGLLDGTPGANEYGPSPKGEVALADNPWSSL